MSQGEIKKEIEDDQILIKQDEENIKPVESDFHESVIEICEDKSDKIIGMHNFVEYSEKKWMLKLKIDPNKRELFRMGLFLCGIRAKYAVPMSKKGDIDNMNFEEIIEKSYNMRNEEDNILVDSISELKNLILSKDFQESSEEDSFKLE
jgi:hypothetical protein